MSHTHVRTAGALRTALVTLAAVLPLLLLGLVAASPAPAAPAAAPTGGWIRVGHLSAGTDGVDVRLSPFAGGGPTDLKDVEYGEFSDYLRVPEGLYTVAVRPAGSEMTVTPMIDETVEVTEGGATTLVATRSGERVVSRVIQDDLTPPTGGDAKVRLISGAGDDQVVSARVVDGPVLADDVTPGSDTGYASVGAQTWSIELSVDGARRSVDQVALRPGAIYTLLVVDAAAGDLRLRAIQDSASSPVMPRGGVDAGGGGLAAPPESDSAATGVAALAGALLLGVVALLVGRRRPGALR